MLQVTPQMRILVATKPVDFRSGIDRLVRCCRAELSSEPLSGAVFVFCNRRRTAIRVLCYDGHGFWLCHKRLSAGRLRWWPDGGGGATRGLEAHELAVLLRGGNPTDVRVAPQWRAVVGAA